MINETYSKRFVSSQNYIPPSNHTFVSAIEQTIVNGVHALKNLIARWGKYRTNRHAFHNLLNLDDHILDDLGVTRGDVIWASKLPLKVNASIELEKIAKENRKRAK